MDKVEVIAALAALAREHRLEVYRLLVQAGHEGMAAGEVAASIGIPQIRCLSTSIGSAMRDSSRSSAVVDR